MDFFASLNFTQILLSTYFSNLGEDANSNFVLSPVSAFITMCMVSHGAHGATRVEIHKGLQFAETSNYCQEAENLLKLYKNESNSDFTLNITNGVFVNEKLAVLQPFQNILAENYEAGFEAVKFGTHEGEKIVNDWISEQTNGKITDVLKNSEPEDLMALINTIYMRGFWFNPFVKTLRINGTFYSPKAEKQIKYMTTTDFFKVSKSKLDCGSKFTTFFMPYRQNKTELDWGMFIIHPQDKKNPVEFKEVISEKLFDIHEKSYQRYVNFRLPESKVESEVDLIPLLEKMGIKLAFSDAADFSGISDVPSKISQVGL